MLSGKEIAELKDVQHLTWPQIMEITGERRDAVRSRYRRYREAIKGAAVSSGSGVQITATGDANTREIESSSARITTLEQLIDYCEIDLSVWTIERHVINKWEVGAKDPATGAIYVEPLFQVKATLIKKEPEPIKPVISPVVIQARFELRELESRRDAEARQLRAALIIPDVQFGFSREINHGRLTPFHDRRALDVVRQIAQVVKPDLSIFIGDLNDYSGWSDKFIRRPEFFNTTQPALIEAAWYVAQIRNRSVKTKVIEGNHDARPERQLIAHLVDAYGLRSADQLQGSPLLSVDNLLGLSRMGVEYVGAYPDSEVWINNETKVIHGEKVRGNPGATAAAVVAQANENIIFGHIHRREMATRTIPSRDGYRTVTAYTPGCLCHVDGRVPGSKRSDQWQQGAAVVWFDDTTTSIVPVDIYQGRAVYGGQVFEGKDYVEELREAGGAWFG